jgi:branched-chain amino acid aminotransferase
MRKSLEFAKKMDHLEVVEEAISPFDLQKQTIVYHKRYQRNTAHNKIQEKKFDVVLAKVLLEKLNEVVRYLI